MYFYFFFHSCSEGSSLLLLSRYLATVRQNFICSIIMHMNAYVHLKLSAPLKIVLRSDTVSTPVSSSMAPYHPNPCTHPPYQKRMSLFSCIAIQSQLSHPFDNFRLTLTLIKSQLELGRTERVYTSKISGPVMKKSQRQTTFNFDILIL